MVSNTRPALHCWAVLVVVLLCVSEFRSTVNAQGDDLENEINPPRKSSGSCYMAGLCCQGRDSTCIVQRAPPNTIIEDLSDVPCYCDHACLKIGDCCSDFKAACGVQDCRVGDWDEWSACNVDCGIGSRTRTRRVILEPRHGGKPCPTLVQKRACRGTTCVPSENRFLQEDAAVILPIGYSAKRKRNETVDITKNLRQRYPKNLARERSKPYCVEYEIIRSSRACKELEDVDSLFEGNRVCAICERDAQRAYLGYKCPGSDTEKGTPTRFSSLKEPACHGKWKKISSDLTCGCSSGAQFIFV